MLHAGFVFLALPVLCFHPHRNVYIITPYWWGLVLSQTLKMKNRTKVEFCHTQDFSAFQSKPWMLNVSSLRDKEWYNSRQYCGCHVTADVSLVQCLSAKLDFCNGGYLRATARRKGKILKSNDYLFSYAKEKGFFFSSSQSLHVESKRLYIFKYLWRVIYEQY